MSVIGVLVMEPNLTDPRRIGSVVGERGVAAVPDCRPISDIELVEVRKFVAEGRSIPAVIVAAILSRMDDAEAALARR